MVISTGKQSGLAAGRDAQICTGGKKNYAVPNDKALHLSLLSRNGSVGMPIRSNQSNEADGA
jgi:hypothetical protein